MLWVACYLVPVFIYQIYAFIYKMIYGEAPKEDEKPKVAGGCPFSSGDKPVEGVENPHEKKEVTAADTSKVSENADT